MPRWSGQPPLPPGKTPPPLGPGVSPAALPLASPVSRPAKLPIASPAILPGALPTATPIARSTSSGPAPVRPVPPAPHLVAPRPVQPAGANTPLLVKYEEGVSPAVVADDPDESIHEPAEFALRNAPPWLVSLIIHCVLMIVLALIYLPGIVRDQLDINAIYAEDFGEQLINDVLDMGDDSDLQNPELSLDTLEVMDPLASAPEVLTTDLGNLFSSEIVAPSIGMALSGREEGAKEALLGAYGGNRITEAAVAEGLEWLRRNQKSNGRWSLMGPYDSGSIIENETAATAMALLAFLGAGHTPERGSYKVVVGNGVRELLEMQDADGNFFRAGQGHHRLYSQAQAMIVVCELYGMTGDSKYRDAAQKAIDYAVSIQSPEGGWRYMPGVDSDTSVTGWFVMGLQSGLMAGLEVPDETLQNVSRFLDSVSVDYGAAYSYQPNGGARRSMTAEGLLCRQYLGWPRNDHRLLEGANSLLENKVDWRDRDVYYWYYATQVLHHMGGKQWTAWNKVMKEVLPNKQVQQGKERGSWDPRADAWGNNGGRLYVTCLSIYMLEVYYRHMPLYKSTEATPEAG